MLHWTRVATVVGSLLWIGSGCSTETRCASPGCAGDAADAGGDAAQTGADAPGPATDAARPDGGGDTLRASLVSAGPNRGAYTAIAATPRAVLLATATGVRRSLDGGDTWALVAAPELVDVAAMATLGTEFFATARDGVYRSTDDGATWQLGLRSQYNSYLSVRGSELYLLAENQPYRWNASTAQWDALRAPDARTFDVIESDGAALYANQASRGGVFRLDLTAPDAAWTPVTSLDPWGYRAFAFGDAEGYAANFDSVFRRAAGAWTRLATPPASVTDLLIAGETLYAAAPDGLHASDDHGASWRRAVSARFASSFALATDGASVFAASDTLWRRRGTAGAWEQRELPADHVQRLVTTGDAVVAITASGFRRWEAGAWTDVRGFENVSPSPFFRPSTLVRHGDEVYAAGPFVVWASTDGGRSFEERSSPVGSLGPLDFLVALPRGLVAGMDLGRTFRLSTDGGRTWSDLPALPSGSPGFGGMEEAQGVLFLTQRYGGATYRSVDDGETWTALADSDALGGVRGIVAAQGVLFGASSAGVVLRSTDLGATWQRAGLAGLPVSSLIVHDGALLAGVGSERSVAGGVYGSTDLGATWRALDPAFTARVSALAVRGQTLVVGTRDRSMWRGLLERQLGN